MADFRVRIDGTSEVPVGGRAIVKIGTFESGSREDVTSVRVLWKSNAGTTLSNETYSGTDISTTATDGGAIEILDITGTGTYEARYSVPAGVYSPTAAGLAFTVQVFIVDEDGNAQTDAITFKVMPADITVSFDTTAVLDIVKRRTGLQDDILIAGSNARGSDLLLDFGAGPVYSIDAAFKNGTAITGGGTDYTWNTYSDYVTLAVAAADTDRFLFRINRRMRDDEIRDYVNESEDKVMAALRPFYSIAALATNPTVEALVAMRATGQLLRQGVKGAALESSRYRDGVDLQKEADEMLRAIKRGEMDLLDTSNDAVARKASSLVGGFKRSKGAITGRLDVVDDIQRWNQILVDYYPERDPDDALDTRSL